ncbi:reverse transcriptase domain, reverse transcriptase zinc-binding domain protein [Tanacetum coccineum]
MASLEELFKVDFKKAFDSVNWNFLLSVMRQMGFGIKWRNWIASCLSLASISVLINGYPSKEFKMERGLRHGDPLSPFLFLLVAEALQFADDALFFGIWSRLNVSNLIRILNCFEMSSGLKVNLDKSRIFGVGIPSSEIESVATSLGCAFDHLPFIYLGLHVGKKMRKCDGWNIIIDRFRQRLSSWKARSLSIGGRRGSVGLNGNLLLDPKFGGLGVGCLLSKNLGLLGKWKSNEDIDTNFKSSFVRKVISGDNTAFWHDPCFVVMGGTWDWRYPPRGRATNELSFLVSCIGNTSGLFKVKSLAKIIQNLTLSTHALGVHHKWNSWISRKVNVCVWRTSLNHLATRVNLVHRGVNISDVACPFCDIEDEDVNHVLISCSRVLPVWRKVWSWWNLEAPVSFPSFSIGDVACGNVLGSGDSILAKILHGVFQIVLWVIWSWRNRVVNAPLNKVDKFKEEDVFPSI